MKSITTLLILTLFFSVTLVKAAGLKTQQASPISEMERRRATSELISILKSTKYFNFIESRIHGVPQDNTQGRFWQSSFWTGVIVTKKNGVVTYTHRNNGSDNIGIHTAPYLEGACYAYRMTGDPRYSRLARKLIRGFTSWILSSQNGVPSPIVLNRSFYPASFKTNDDGRSLVVNYEAARPGVNSDASEYVQRSQNPYFGDIWIKNNRSIDDIGHMLRAMAQVQVCRDLFDNDTRRDLDQMNRLYTEWARTVVDTGFVIPTLNAQGQIEVRRGSIGDYNNYDYFGFKPNCNAKLALQLISKQQSNFENCDNGMSWLEQAIYSRLTADALEIQRSNHQAAILWSELSGRSDLSQNLRQGLSVRLQKDFELIGNSGFDVQDVGTEVVHLANLGIPLSTDQIRFLYGRIQQANASLMSSKHHNTFHLFESSVPDGEYSYDAPGEGLYFYTFAAMLGSCSSRWAQQPLFKCDQIRNALSTQQ